MPRDSLWSGRALRCNLLVGCDLVGRDLVGCGLVGCGLVGCGLVGCGLVGWGLSKRLDSSVMGCELAGFSLYQLMKSLDLQFKDCSLEPHCQPECSLIWTFSKSLLQIGSTASEHHDKNNGGPNQWIIRVQISPPLPSH